MLNKLTDVTTVGVRNDWFEAGRSLEDGTEIVGDSFILEAETPDGFRFQHNYQFCTGRMEYDDDGFNHWRQDREADQAKAQALANKILAHLEQGGSLNADIWYPVQGCYGSAGWDEQAECELEAREREEEGWGR